MSETHRETLKIALYGKYGTTKTLQIARLAEVVGVQNVGIVSAESGLTTIASVLAIMPPENIWTVASLDDVRATWAKVAEFAKRPGVWVCIDGMTTLLTWYEAEIWGNTDRFFERYIRKDSIPDSLKPYQRFIVKDKETIDPQSVYAVVGRRICDFYTGVLQLGCNFYVNFMEEMHGQAGRERALPWGPDIPGKMGKNFMLAKTDFIGGLHYDDERRVIASFDPASRQYLGKTRNDRAAVVVPAEIPDFDLGAFVRLIQPKEA